MVTKPTTKNYGDIVYDDLEVHWKKVKNVRQT